jgi:hypothetical protein
MIQIPNSGPFSRINVNADFDIKRWLVRLHKRTELEFVDIQIELPIIPGRLDTNLFVWQTLKVEISTNMITMTIDHKNKCVWDKHITNLCTAGSNADKDAWETAWSLMMETAFDELQINHAERCQELSDVLPLDRHLLDLVVEKEAHLAFPTVRRQNMNFRYACWKALQTVNFCAFVHIGSSKGRDATWMLEQLLLELDREIDPISRRALKDLCFKRSLRFYNEDDLSDWFVIHRVRGHCIFIKKILVEHYRMSLDEFL